MRFTRLLQTAFIGGLMATLALACGPAQEPTPTPAPAAAPAATPTKAPAAAPTVAAPAPTVAPALAATPTPTKAPAVAAPTAAPPFVGIIPLMPPDPMTPQYGGILRLPETSAGQGHFDVLQYDGEGPTMRQIQNVYNRIVQPDRYDPNTVYGKLAESWQWSSDARTLTFNLRKGVKWQDGKPFVAADVAYTIERMRKPKPGIISRRLAEWTNLESVETPNDSTVVLRLKQPQLDLVPTLSGYTMQVVPKHLAEPLDGKGEGMKYTIVGTGPFRMKKFEPDVFWEYERNPNYFVPGRPYLDGFRYTLMAEEETRVAAYLAGQIHSYGGVRSQANINLLLSKDPDLKLLEYASNVIMAFVPNVTRPPFNDIRVRQAAALTFDHKAFAKAAGPINNFSILGVGYRPGSPWALPAERRAKIPGFDFDADNNADIAKAYDLVKQAGYTGKVKVAMESPNLDYFSTAAIIAQEQLNKGPFDVDLKIVEYAVYVENQDKVRQTAVAHSMGLKFTTIDGALGECCTAAGRRNFGKWGKEEFGTLTPVDKELENLFTRQSGETDVNKRMQLVHDYQDLFLRQYYHIQLAWQRNTALVGSRRVHNSWATIDGYSGTYHEDMWLESQYR